MNGLLHRHRGSLYRYTRVGRQEQKIGVDVPRLAESDYKYSQETTQTDGLIWSPSKHYTPRATGAASELDTTGAANELLAGGGRLREENRQLSEEVRQLRVLLAHSHEQESREVANPVLAAAPDDRTRAAEMLVELDREEAEMMVRVLGSDRQPVSEIVHTLGPAKSLRMSSVLASCHAVVVDNDSIVTTEFGRSLFRWIMAQTEQS